MKRDLHELMKEGRARLPESEVLLPSEILKLMFLTGLNGSGVTDKIIEIVNLAFFIGAGIAQKGKDNKYEQRSNGNCQGIT